ncbi:MAG: patatin-like protein [Microcystis panniformis Mp_MB_F_20051200_S9]|uniref:Patatin-like protein n=1 Tax=Microcystis panniformis Mp_MB_F_20051200_S9 TaxID=2486223 RepID=A0A552Q2J6_9CHRO|nr:MAG: patatin-like protein [Microcystis panniformis Mp_GB_SS_20050300_S99]TRV48728.1 MAG: patatin-like protein [Microcystis panniformis Mp_MB_F_20080800_S26D]TRV54971.1 MAG: patatin-like protein [Microcystis panniformis Mp_MB_F_20080800_S26]TRV55499.1 MAG: patatin-like protein [Microcystis panniformis Mp_GB_SS_20050300_S99D]TRV63408.1 MAG: patatin-like protein [Microcystis panniformis Mp_MB_F_20051200_S9]TRV65651.1 MAG: patatin-like protein [Microcystis panniformis Mp_MB_F_20051200_S9D]TRV7
MTATPDQNTQSSSATCLKKPDFRKETRLGLVLYGGVSLAVYMNGVCREFYNATRGRGIYKLIKALTDSDIVVDIVSGTSAGGINGVLLSYAVANSYEKIVVDFKEFGDIWRESGDINKLLRPLKKENNQIDVNSLLNGEGYYQEELFKAFEKAGNNQESAPNGEWYSEFNELDLFITGTDVLGRIHQTFDNTGKVIEIKDHRCIFQLKYREDQDVGDPFSTKDADTQKALAKLCRITSCFPLAFPVVPVEIKSDNKVDNKLQEWGKLLRNRILPPKPPGGYKLYFVDGGVLDNRPFSYTTEAIYYRTADRPVNRQLFYLDPNPESFVNSSKFTEMEQPTVWEVITGSLISLPRYESIGKDLQQIKDINDKIRRYNLLLKSVDEEVHEQTTEAKNRYWRCRLVSLRDSILSVIFDNQYFIGKEREQEELLEKSATLLTKFINNLEEIKNREETLNSLAQNIENLDIQYAIRKHNFLLAQIYSLMSDAISKDTDNIAKYTELKNLANKITWLLELLKVIDQVVKEAIKSEPVRQKFYQLITEEEEDNNQESRNLKRKKIYNYLLTLLCLILDSQDLADVNVENLKELDFDKINFIRGQLRNRVKVMALDHDWEALTITKGETILEKIEQASGKLLTEQSKNIEENIKPVIGKFEKFQLIDQVIYPYKYLSDIRNTSPIKLVRISPNDADKGFGKGKGLEEKLAGDQFRAFGGFFKKSWRSNDILWGRLDGVNRIVDGLLTSESLKAFSGVVSRQIELEQFSGTQEEKIQEYVKRLVDESFPTETQTEKDKLIQDLIKLAQPNTTLAKEELEEFLNKLVNLGHSAILKENLGNVFKDAISEQLEWNQQKIDPTPESNYKYVGGYFDKAVTPLAAAELAKRSLEDLKGKEKEYFRDEYGVGSETIGKDIPSNILKSLGTRSAIILSYIIESSKTGKRLLGLQSYQLLKQILNIYYFLSQRSSPSSYKTQASPLISALKSLLLFTIAFGVIAYLLNILPRLAVLTIATLALLWIIKNLLGVLFGRTSK